MDKKRKEQCIGLVLDEISQKRSMEESIDSLRKLGYDAKEINDITIEAWNRACGLGWIEKQIEEEHYDNVVNMFEWQSRKELSRRVL